MSGENGAPGAKKKAVLPKLSFRFKLGGASASGAASPSNAATWNGHPSSSNITDDDDGGKKKRDFDAAVATFEDVERGGDEGANRATKKQKKDADAMTELELASSLAQLFALWWNVEDNGPCPFGAFWLHFHPFLDTRS